MFTDFTLSNDLNEKLRAEYDERNANHVSSGKLSASILGWPVQWQVLKIIGVEPKAFDDYSLGKFKRGDECEAYATSALRGMIEQQKKIEYRGVTGYVDAVVDTSSWPMQYGVIPHEIKSVANAKYKWIEKRNEADESHRLQACLYALAMKAEYYVIHYVAADDYRVKSFFYSIVEDDYFLKIDQIIDKFYNTLKSRIVPVFEANYSWQENPKYCNYPEWVSLTEDEIERKLQHYPEALAKLNSY